MIIPHIFTGSTPASAIRGDHPTKCSYENNSAKQKYLSRTGNGEIDMIVHARGRGPPGGDAELRNDRCSSATQLKTLTRGFKAQGFKVLANKGAKQ